MIYVLDEYGDAVPRTAFVRCGFGASTVVRLVDWHNNFSDSGCDYRVVAYTPLMLWPGRIDMACSIWKYVQVVDPVKVLHFYVTFPDLVDDRRRYLAAQEKK